MSETAEALWHELQKLSPAEQQGLLQRMMQTLTPTAPSLKPQRFQTVKLPGGRITAKQVAEILDDE
ncbi:MAG: hypothetical protein M9920_09645 [Verrucomicrobiae bacterium]|nr:hypothetical protein [Verrucomicrobiae bacterium]